MQIQDYLYQNKMYQPLTGKKLDDMKQALGVIRLTLAKNVAFNILNEKKIVDLMKTLSNMYEKPSTNLMKHCPTCTRSHLQPTK
uniref:Retrovirus-related Pol polyprotein from transposon TNT 1-94 n=2 Tax=Cajanus cajan TaxID=3821 RepID=A0A151U702_CAJCA|nr:hypothetical protein KK1_007760 [Cajanus cajan]